MGATTNLFNTALSAASSYVDKQESKQRSQAWLDIYKKRNTNYQERTNVINKYSEAMMSLNERIATLQYEKQQKKSNFKPLASQNLEI